MIGSQCRGLASYNRTRSLPMMPNQLTGVPSVGFSVVCSVPPSLGAAVETPRSLFLGHIAASLGHHRIVVTTTDH